MSSASSRPQDPATVADVTRALSSVLWKIHELEATIASYDASHADILEQRLVQYEKLLAASRDMLRPRAAAQGGDGSPTTAAQQRSNTLEERKLPEELIVALDKGVNPDEYLRATFTAAKRDNEIIKGKCEGLRQLGAQLLTDAQDVLPQEAAHYRKLIGL